jgi:hypothetical protein
MKVVPNVLIDLLVKFQIFRRLLSVFLDLSSFSLLLEMVKAKSEILFLFLTGQAREPNPLPVLPLTHTPRWSMCQQLVFLPSCQRLFSPIPVVSPPLRRCAAAIPHRACHDRATALTGSLCLCTLCQRVPFLAAVGTHIVVAHLALAFSLHLVASVLATAAIPATMTSPGAGSRPILGLHVGHPLLLREEQTTASLLGRGQLLALLNGTQVADGFLDQERVESEQCLHGDRNLLELVGDDMEYLLDQLLVGDVITEDTQLVGHDVETHQEVFNNLASLKRDVVELVLNSLGVGFLDLVGTYVHLPDHFLGFRRCGLHR